MPGVRSRHGALAIVEINDSPAPGLGTYTHYNWEVGWQRSKDTVMVSIPRRYVMPDGTIAQDYFKANLPSWTKDTDGGGGAFKREAHHIKLTIHLTSPEANEFARLFKSASWCIILQVLIPLAGLLVCANAFAQILIERSVSFRLSFRLFTCSPIAVSGHCFKFCFV